MNIEYFKYCKTDRQKEVLEAVIENGSYGKAAKALNCSKSSVTDVITSIKKNATKMGYSPEHGMTNAVPEGYILKGISTLHAADGSIKQQWVKASADMEYQKKVFLDSIEALKETVVRPKLTEVYHTGNDLLNLYTITDYHLGMMAYGEESGEDWNTAKSEEVLYSTLDNMIKMAYPARTSVLNLQGDFLHTDGLEALTPMNKHLLDTDVRFPNLIKIAVRAIKLMVSMLTEKSERVILLIAQGNHDLSSSQWLQSLFEMYYEDCPNVEVIVSPNPYYCIEHGKTMLVFHHGHRADTTKMAQIIPGMFPKEWGNTEYRYAHMGHRHHKLIKEGFGLIVEQHQTISPKDAYSSHGGYIAERGANVITYHPEKGELARVTIRP